MCEGKYVMSGAVGGEYIVLGNQTAILFRLRPSKTDWGLTGSHNVELAISSQIAFREGRV